ncbi:hypothetical protein EDB92DRAFT_468260 [Lactarius akahatsu]|uniref:Uncharacterized protein n=1 Tax=Lactarius akahatsu TaxID=416441 RepID=A0AAD4LTK3_9AGAM|nr:hypothetical protein EDB92DRAFT_468260 [Lactarius akahatsu]
MYMYVRRMGVCVYMYVCMYVCVCAYACMHVCAIRSPINESRMFPSQPVRVRPYTVHLSVAYITPHASASDGVRVSRVGCGPKPPSNMHRHPSQQRRLRAPSLVNTYRLPPTLPWRSISHLPVASSTVSFYQIGLKSAIIAVLEASELRASLSIIIVLPSTAIA